MSRALGVRKEKRVAGTGAKKRVQDSKTNNNVRKKNFIERVLKGNPKGE